MLGKLFKFSIYYLKKRFLTIAPAQLVQYGEAMIVSTSMMINVY